MGGASGCARCARECPLLLGVRCSFFGHCAPGSAFAGLAPANGALLAHRLVVGCNPLLCLYRLSGPIARRVAAMAVCAATRQPCIVVLIAPSPLRLCRCAGISPWTYPSPEPWRRTAVSGSNPSFFLAFSLSLRPIGQLVSRQTSLAPPRGRLGPWTSCGGPTARRPLPPLKSHSTRSRIW